MEFNFHHHDPGSPDDVGDDDLWTDVPWDDTYVHGFIWFRYPPS